MIIYNVTIKIDLDVHDEWLAWMKLEHIPRVLATGYFHDHRMLRILEEDQRDGISYAVQYTAKNLQDYFTYEADHAPALRQEVSDRYPDKFVAFRTLLKVV
jgi:hypothetical protein